MLARFQQAIDAHGMARVTLHRADVLDEAGLPAGWQDHDLVLCASLRARMAPGARTVVMITRRSWETRLLIDWLWHAHRYGRRTVAGAFVAAGFGTPRFVRFPRRYGWLNRANHVVLAENPGETTGAGESASPA
ncbi:hypothetical protein [Frateuria soli]|uniref:hypothetical protein n=1 Tax=Frateuria soli TaxID=1542730 RepID=UPI001E324326|nr:hypothetical protein [Frateuria soli]UGB37679.1 hypothetical protein LQ771_12720 [Frateuria soli]